MLYHYFTVTREKCCSVVDINKPDVKYEQQKYIMKNGKFFHTPLEM
jgi:hypothetical protein